MYNYPVEKHIIRFYKYKFLGYEDKPLVIEAYSKLEARQKLTYYLEKFPMYQNIPVISESVSLPLYGVSEKIIDGIECVWVGELSQTGWMPIEEFARI